MSVTHNAARAGARWIAQGFRDRGRRLTRGNHDRAPDRAAHPVRTDPIHLERHHGTYLPSPGRPRSDAQGTPSRSASLLLVVFDRAMVVIRTSRRVERGSQSQRTRLGRDNVRTAQQCGRPSCNWRASGHGRKSRADDSSAGSEIHGLPVHTTGSTVDDSSATVGEWTEITGLRPR